MTVTATAPWVSSRAPSLTGNGKSNGKSNEFSSRPSYESIEVTVGHESKEELLNRVQESGLRIEESDVMSPEVPEVRPEEKVHVGCFTIEDLIGGKRMPFPKLCHEGVNRYGLGLFSIDTIIQTCTQLAPGLVSSAYFAYFDKQKPYMWSVCYEQNAWWCFVIEMEEERLLTYAPHVRKKIFFLL